MTGRGTFDIEVVDQGGRIQFAKIVVEEKVDALLDIPFVLFGQTVMDNGHDDLVGISGLFFVKEGQRFCAEGMMACFQRSAMDGLAECREYPAADCRG